MLNHLCLSPDDQNDSTIHNYIIQYIQAQQYTIHMIYLYVFHLVKRHRILVIDITSE